MGSKVGVLKVAAKRIGMSVEEYQSLQDRGMKYCYACKDWHPIADFGVDLSRGDRLTAICKAAKSRTPRKGRVQPREQIRAHRLIQNRVHRGTLPPPGDLPCSDCGHGGSDRRHEYDHYLGYGPGRNDKVQVVCSLCHAQRHKERRQHGRENCD